MRVIGYKFDATIYCPACTARAWRDGYLAPAADYHNLPPGFDEHGIPYALQDREGNPIHPVFDIDETSPLGEYCGECGAEVAPSYEP